MSHMQETKTHTHNNLWVLCIQTKKMNSFKSKVSGISLFPWLHRQTWFSDMPFAFPLAKKEHIHSMETSSWLCKHTRVYWIWACHRARADTTIPLPLWITQQPATQTTQALCPPDRIQGQKRARSPSKSSEPVEELCLALYQPELTNFMAPWLLPLLESFSILPSSGQILAWEYICLFSVSTWFCYQWKVTLEMPPCGLSLTERPVPPTSK